MPDCSAFIMWDGLVRHRGLWVEELEAWAPPFRLVRKSPATSRPAPVTVPSFRNLRRVLLRMSFLREIKMGLNGKFSLLPLMGPAMFEITGVGGNCWAGAQGTTRLLRIKHERAGAQPHYSCALTTAF